ncbi:MAG: glycine dehydrogenase (aminomethyl-transferring), partial [Bacteroidota bacterium]
MKIQNIRPAVFADRHIGSGEKDSEAMLAALGLSSVEELIKKTVPESIRRSPMNLPPALDEQAYLAHIRELASANKIFRSYIGMGYYDTITPNVILRNIMENPGWYTAYTPYQAEIAQGRLEALINFQTLVCDLTALPVSNASLLDEATAAAEAMSMLYHVRKPNRQEASSFFVSELCHPQTIDVLKTRSEPLGINLLIGNHFELDFNSPDIFGALVQYPATDGLVMDYTDFISSAHEAGVLVAVAADLLSLTLLTPPGEMGADVAVGTTQRFGVPMGFGGPHAAFFSTREEYKRQIPGRIIGMSVDAQGNKAYRMALQTREQHIRREKATSNICTSQVLLAVMAGAYAVYHGPQGLTDIALRVHGMAQLVATGLQQLEIGNMNAFYFDTIKVAVHDSMRLRDIAEAKEINFRYFEDGKHIGI